MAKPSLQLFYRKIPKSLNELSEHEALEFLTKHYKKIAPYGYPLVTEDMALQKELTAEYFGSRCRQYEFILIKLDQDRNLIVRRKRDGLALTTKFQEPVRRTSSSGTVALIPQSTDATS